MLLCRYREEGVEGVAFELHLGFVCFVVFNPRVLQANRVDCGVVSYSFQFCRP